MTFAACIDSRGSWTIAQERRAVEGSVKYLRGEDLEMFEQTFLLSTSEEKSCNPEAAAELVIQKE